MLHGPKILLWLRPCDGSFLCKNISIYEQGIWRRFGFGFRYVTDFVTSQVFLKFLKFFENNFDNTVFFILLFSTLQCFDTFVVAVLS